MALFDFLKKKKEDDLGEFGADFGPEFGAESGMPGIPGSPGLGAGPGMGAIPPPRPGAVSGAPGTGQLFGAPQTPPPPMQPTPINLGPQPITPVTQDTASKLELI